MSSDQRQARLIAEKRRRIYRECFGSPCGREVLADLTERCFAMRSTFVSENPHLTSYREGMRAAYLLIAGQLAQDADDTLALAEYYPNSEMVNL